MKKTLFLSICLLAVLAFFSSCSQQCSTCTYSVDDPLGGDPIVTTIPEVCGSRAEIEAYEESAEATAQLAGVTAICVRE